MRKNETSALIAQQRSGMRGFPTPGPPGAECHRATIYPTGAFPPIQECQHQKKQLQITHERRAEPVRRERPVPEGHATIAQRFNVGLISAEIIESRRDG